MFDRKAIMQAAWKMYREAYRRLPFFRDGFRWALTEAWRRARVCATDPAVKAARAAAIRAEIDGLKYKSLRYDITRTTVRLQAELATLEA